MKILATLLLFLPLFSRAQEVKFPISQFLANHAKGGLSLRTEPNRSAEKVKLIPYGDHVQAISYIDKTERISGIYGEWFRVIHLKDTGYVFGPYLSDMPASTKEREKYPYIKDYLFENFRLTDGTADFEIVENYEDFEADSEFGEMIYGFVGSECDFTENLYIPNITLQEAIIVMCPFFPAYNKIKLSSSLYSDENYEGKPTYSFDEEGVAGFWKEYHLNLERNGGNEITFYNVSFDWEGGGGHLSFDKWGPNGVRITHSYYCH